MERLDKNVGEIVIESNWLDCLCCGELKHRQKDSDIKVKALSAYKEIQNQLSSEITNAVNKILEKIEKADVMVTLTTSRGTKVDVEEFNLISNTDLLSTRKENQ